MEVLWPMDCAVDGGEGQPEPELGPGGSCGIHSWIEGASGDGRRVSSFAQDSWFEGLFAGFLDDTGQTGGRDRSDRSVWV